MPLPVGRDLEKTRGQLAHWLARRLPAASDVRLSELSGPSATGYSSDTLLFDAEWTEHGAPRRRSLVARIQPAGYRVFPFYDVWKQHRILEILARHSDVRVPRVFANEDDPGWIGSPFYVMDRLEGRVPTDSPPYHAGGWVPELSLEERRALWMNGLVELARFHSIDAGKLPLEFLDWTHLGATPMQRHIEFYRRYYEWAARGIPHPVVEAGLRWLGENLPTPERDGLSWGDSRISNIIYRGVEPLALLDWEMMALGDPEQDLAWWIFVDRCLSEGVGMPRLAGLPGVQETLERYEELVGRAVRHFHYYTIWAGVRFSVIMMRLAQQQVEYGTMTREQGLAFEHQNMVSTLLARDLGL